MRIKKVSVGVSSIVLDQSSFLLIVITCKVSNNSVEDRENGGGSPLVRSSTQFADE
jgi:hypothetical protein